MMPSPEIFGHMLMFSYGFPATRGGSTCPYAQLTPLPHLLKTAGQGFDQLGLQVQHVLHVFDRSAVHGLGQLMVEEVQS